MSQDNDKKNLILEDEKAILLDHEYDGIQELDNSLPSWWLMTFYGAIVFSIFYVGYYHVFGGPSLSQELAASMASIKSAQAEKKQALSNTGDEELVAALGDEERLAAGKEVYIGKCAACHGQAGEGLIGPNLTDEYWIHGQGSFKDIMTAIAEGFPDKGMPPWGPLLTEQELKDATVYVKSLQGTNPPNGKEPQGEKVSMN